MTHIVLLGDSIFDNRSYTRGAPDVVTHMVVAVGGNDLSSRPSAAD